MIPDKQTFVKLSQSGMLGNTFRQWNTLADLHASGYDRWVTIRAVQCGNRKLFRPCVQVDHLRGYPEDSRVYYQECPLPDADRIINFEAARRIANRQPWFVRYALNDHTNLRHSLERNGRDATGLTALHILQLYVPPEDMGAMDEIWEQHPDAIIEGTVFQRPMGTQDRKLIIWEVRDF